MPDPAPVMAAMRPSSSPVMVFSSPCPAPDPHQALSRAGNSGAPRWRTGCRPAATAAKANLHPISKPWPMALDSEAGCMGSPRPTTGRVDERQTLTIGDVTITSIIERDGPWRKPEDMFPAYDPDIGRRHLAEMAPGVFDHASGKMIITYQTFVVRTPKHTVLIDTCTGEDKGHPPPMDFPKQPWL